LQARAIGCCLLLIVGACQARRTDTAESRSSAEPATKAQASAPPPSADRGPLRMEVLDPNVSPPTFDPV